MNQINRLKKNLSVVFDDELATTVWKNYVDYFILFTILLSSAHVVLFTYLDIRADYRLLLDSVHVVTVVLFTIEIALRTWTCGLVDPQYKGWKGKVKYSLSFYGIIDLLSILPFYLSLIFPISIGIVLVLKLLRIFRLMQYGATYKLLLEAIKNKSSELIISTQVLIIVTLFLSVVLFYIENTVQAEVFDSVTTSIVWAFSQYLGDPAGMGDFVPITFIGQSVAFMIGILGIAIFAVPAGLIGSSLLEVISDKKLEEETNINIVNIKSGFRNVLHKVTQLYFPPIFQRIETIKSKLDIDESEILRAIKSSPNLRTRNLASALSPKPENRIDVTVVECFPVNCGYGSFIDRKSNITIVNSVGRSEAGIGHFAYHVANLGGFNYVSNEYYSLIELDTKFVYGFYNVYPDLPVPEDFITYKNNLLSVAKTNNDWLLFFLSTEGYTGETIFDADFHFLSGGKRGEENFEFENCTIKDTAKFKTFYEGFGQKLKTAFDKNITTHKYYANQSPKNIGIQLSKICDANILSVRVMWDLTVRSQAIVDGVMKLLAEEIKTSLAGSDSTLNLDDYSTRHF